MGICLTRDNDGSDSEQFFHELIHIGQYAEENGPNHVMNYLYDWVNFYIPFEEGEATFHQLFTSKCSSQKFNGTYRQNREGYSIWYNKPTIKGYPEYLYIYKNLVYLIGYDNMDKLRGRNMVGQIKTKIREQYGADAANEIIDGLKDWVSTIVEDREEPFDAAYNAGIKLHKAFLKWVVKNPNLNDAQKCYYAETVPNVYDPDEYWINPEIFPDAYAGPLATWEQSYYENDLANDREDEER